MPRPARYGVANATEPVVHELPALKLATEEIPMRIVVRRGDDGIWRGRVVFGAGETNACPSTTDIFCAATEPEFWEAVRGLSPHHFADLYRSVVP